MKVTVSWSLVAKDRQNGKMCPKIQTLSFWLQDFAFSPYDDNVFEILFYYSIC